MMICFANKQFPSATILMAVRWYVAYKLSYREIEELLAERGVNVDHATIHRWVLEYEPQLDTQFRTKNHQVSGSWRMDETYIKVKGKWYYLYQAVDKYEMTVDFVLSEKRDEAAASKFFQKAIHQRDVPEKVVKVTDDISRRERKKLMLREALIETAYELFVKKGFDETRIEDITNKVDVSSRTFFRYFSCKEDVVLEYQDVEHEEIVAALAGRPAGEPIMTALRHAAVEVTKGCEEGSYGLDPNRFKTLRSLIRNHPLVCAKNLTRSQARKDALVSLVAKKMGVNPKQDVRPAIITASLEFAYSAAYDVWKEREVSGVPYSDILDEVFGYIEEGLNF